MIPQDQIIEWAREAGFFVTTELNDVDQRYAKFAALVAQFQKEQDAAMVKSGCGYSWDEIAAAIRSQE